MKAANDNYGDEPDVLLEMAYKIVSKYRGCDCPLEGTTCPLMNIATHPMEVRDGKCKNSN